VTVKLQQRTQNNVNHAIVVVSIVVGIMLKVLTAVHSKHYTQTYIYHSYTVIHTYIFIYFFPL